MLFFSCFLTLSHSPPLLFLFDWQIVNYNYYYSLNAWLLLCPWWLCFDWSMGCVPLIKSATDWRMVWLLLLWCSSLRFLSPPPPAGGVRRMEALRLSSVMPSGTLMKLMKLMKLPAPPGRAVDPAGAQRVGRCTPTSCRAAAHRAAGVAHAD